MMKLEKGNLLTRIWDGIKFEVVDVLENGIVIKQHPIYNKFEFVSNFELLGYSLDLAFQPPKE